eukprot:TRINITY_DN5776_c1_g1_i3.p3 TRINITY_DN5776_c1_g1~~TRINITY_DN5776_c1_g1_i3.p3  ORF type:complete len:235 (-),score=-19.27 TRINITY_DN5776_c1_g1_i3:215-919(-)
MRVYKIKICIYIILCNFPTTQLFRIFIVKILYYQAISKIFYFSIQHKFLNQLQFNNIIQPSNNIIIVIIQQYDNIFFIIVLQMLYITIIKSIFFQFNIYIFFKYSTFKTNKSIFLFFNQKKSLSHQLTIINSTQKYIQLFQVPRQFTDNIHYQQFSKYKQLIKKINGLLLKYGHKYNKDVKINTQINSQIVSIVNQHTQHTSLELSKYSRNNNNSNNKTLFVRQKYTYLKKEIY